MSNRIHRIVLAAAFATAALLGAAPGASAATGTSCTSQFTRAATAPAKGWVSARLSRGSGDWDVTVTERNSGRRAAASSGFGSEELAQGIVAGGTRVSVRACRVSRRGRRPSLGVSFAPFPPGGGEKTSLVRVNTPNEHRKRELTKLDLDLTEHGGKNFVAVLLHGPADARKLRENKFAYTVQVADMAKRSLADRRKDAIFARSVRASALPSGRTGYRRLADYEAELKKLARENPGLVKPITLPYKTWEGRSVHGVEITTNPGRRDGKPVFFNMALHHAREWPSGEHSMEWAYELVNGYKRGDARTRRLVRSVRTIVVPVVNPDGFNISREAGAAQGADGGRGTPNPGQTNETANIVSHPYEYRRKNCRQPEGEGGSCLQPSLGVASIGVDPNRNYGAFWGGPGASGDFTNETYYGPSAFSEPETKNVRHVVSTRHVTTLITNHTFSDLVLRAPGLKSQGLAADEPAMKRLGDAMAAENGYLSLYGWQLYDTTGTTEDWSYSTTGGYGYTFEIGCPQLDRVERECDEGHFHPPFSEVIKEYDGDTPQANQARDGKGNREAYYKAMENTADARQHSRLRGRGAGGLILRAKKSFATPTSQDNNGDNKPDSFKDVLNTTYEVPTNGRVNWHVNPSTRPAVAKGIGRAPRGRPSPTQRRANNTPPVPACPSYHEGVALPGCFREHSITIPQGAGIDNGFATIRVEWATIASDYDIEVYKDTNGNGVRNPGEPLEGTSGQGNTDFEQVTAGPDPRGKYVLRVINYAATEPYDVETRFRAPSVQVRAGTERWSVSCETFSGRVLATSPVYVKRGSAASPRVGRCIRALVRSCRRGNGDRPTRRARGKRLDRVRLGGSRTKHLRAYRYGRKRRGSVDRFCLSDRRYVRVGYPSKKLRRGLGRSLRKRYRKQKAVLALTTSKRFRIRKVRVGMKVGKMRKRIGRRKGIRVGKNVWYLRRTKSTTQLFKVTRRKVREVGIANKQLTQGRKRAKRFLRTFN